MTPTSKAIELISGQRTRKTVRACWRQGDGKFDLDERDNPLPAFNKAFDALTPLIATILHIDAPWSATNCRVVGLKLGEQGGAATVSLICRKSFDDASKEFVFTTPPRLLAHPTEPGSYTPPLAGADADLVWSAAEVVKDYIKGDRAQGVITFEEEDEPAIGDTPPAADDTAPLPFADTGKPAKKTRRKREPAAV